MIKFNNMKLKNNAILLSWLSYKVLYERRYEVFYERSCQSFPSIAIRKCRIFILIKFTCIHGFSLNCSRKVAINCFFCRAPCTYHLAKWLATCTQKLKVPSSSPAPSYVQRKALCRITQLMPKVPVKWVEVVERS